MNIIRVNNFLIYILAIVFQLLGITVIKVLFPNEIIIYDPRFLQVAENLLNTGRMEIHWGVGPKPADLMINPYNIQKGIYNNWFPPAYSIFIYLNLIIDRSYTLLIFSQLILFGLIPVIFINILRSNFGNYLSEKHYFLITIFFMINPYYIVSSLWKTDTWFTTFIVIFLFYILIKFDKKRTPVYAIIISACLIILFFLRPVSIPAFIILLLIVLNKEKKNFKKLKYVGMTLIPLIITISIWTFNNYKRHNVISFTYSNVGYNLWLGNNEFTYQFLRKHLGDGATIEDFIIPKFDQKWEFLSHYSEYQKDRFFRTKAIEYMINNPIITIKNMMWKFIGFWSPLRVRNGHWSDSKVKKILLLLYQTPIILLSFLSIIRWILGNNFNGLYSKYLLILLIFWIIPHLFFFSTTRFRAPVDFAILIIAIDYLLPYLSKFNFYEVKNYQP